MPRSETCPRAWRVPCLAPNGHLAIECTADIDSPQDIGWGYTGFSQDFRERFNEQRSTGEVYALNFSPVCLPVGPWKLGPDI
jgi:hypothetical protein